MLRSKLLNPIKLKRISKPVNNRKWFYSTQTKQYENILVEKKGKVGVVTLNRPKALNALCDPLILELNEALRTFQNDPEIGSIIITGSQKAFAAGADIKEMADKTSVDMYTSQKFKTWEEITTIKKPIIAAVSGFALGGGCELAMTCDIILASKSAKFGQPEIKLGTIPGVGGSQRLTKAIGKSKSMELNLTGEFIDAETAERWGLVSRVVPDETLLDEALKLGEKISSFSQPIVAMVKECVNKSYDLSLTEGINYERKIFYSTFATEDQKIGMSAFVAKQNPEWKHK